jgi:hypothetical protein
LLLGRRLVIGRKFVMKEIMKMQFGKRLVCGLLFLGLYACQTKMADKESEARDISMLKNNDSIQLDSIRRLSERLSHLEEAKANGSGTKNKTGTREASNLTSDNASASSGNPSSVIKTFGLQDTMHVSAGAVILSNTCRWYFKGVEEEKPVQSKGNKECNFHGAKDIVYVNEREVSLDDIKRTRDYEFEVGSKLRTYCPNITLVLECR